MSLKSQLFKIFTNKIFLPETYQDLNQKEIKDKTKEKNKSRSKTNVIDYIFDIKEFDKWNTIFDTEYFDCSNTSSIDSKLISCSNDKSIKIWDLKSFECLETFLHTEPIKNLLKFNNNIFISFYRNNFVQLWDLSQKLCVKSFYSSDISQNFNCVRFISGIKFVRAHYNYIKIWELGDSNELTLKGHQGMIFDLLILANRKSLVSCSSDKKIKVWNNQGKCIITFKGHKNWILCLVELKNGNLASGSLDKTIKIWNIETKICINTLKGHKRGITILERNIRGVELFSASFEGIIKIWNSDAGVCLKTLDGHNNSISSLVLHSNFLFSSSYDKSIKIWNLDSGECERTLLGHCDIINKLIIF